MRSLSWRLPLRVIAVLSWLVSIVWLIIQPGFEPLLAFLTGVAAFLGSFAVSDAPITSTPEYHPTPAQRERNRRAMLEMVKTFWVKGVLEQSVHGAVVFELGLQERADLVAHPWDIVLQTSGQCKRPIPRSTKVVSIFNAMNQALLILGAPGSGKTTMLLELARDAIARAEKDTELPIPVVLNLSSWTDKGQSISDWLVDEINAKYYVPRRVARSWVGNDDLLLLLDGLDEVKPELREACVEAINEFRQQHGPTPLAICSRIEDYEALTNRLKLLGAIVLQPLTSQQVEDYLASAGDKLQTLRAALHADAGLQELAQMPLMLNIMWQAYYGIPDRVVLRPGTLEERRSLLFKTYVERMLTHRAIHGHYAPRLIIHWLVWLAKTMSEHSQSVFLLERIQPSWLQARIHRWAYAGSYVLIVGLTTALVGLLASGLVDILILRVPVRTLLDMLQGQLCLVMIVSFLVFLFQFVRSGNPLRQVQAVETLTWSWRLARERVRLGLGCGVTTGLITGLFFFLVAMLSPVVHGGEYGVPFDWTVGIALGMGAVSLIWGLGGGLGYGLIAGLTGSEMETKTIPNQGIRRSGRNGVLVGLGFSLVSWLFFTLALLALSLVLGVGFTLFTESDLSSELPLGRPAEWVGAALFVGLFFGRCLDGVLEYLGDFCLVAVPSFNTSSYASSSTAAAACRGATCTSSTTPPSVSSCVRLGVAISSSIDCCRIILHRSTRASDEIAI